MSSAQRIWLLAGVLVATFTIYLLIQASFREAETQNRSENSGRGPSFRESGKREIAPDRVIVKLKEGVSSETLERENRSRGARTKKKIPRTRLSVVEPPADVTVEEAVRSYETSPNVEYAEPDFILRPTQTSSANDSYYPRLYGLNNTGQNGGTADADVDAPEAWNNTTGDSGTVVAVIDEGVDIDHPDLRNNIWSNPNETPGNGVDDDRNGYVDDVHGWDFANNDASVYDPDPVSGAGDEHGTHVAGTIAAEGNNGVGVTGVSWRARIMPLKFLGPNGGYTSDAVEALNYAVAKGAKISNNSWGGGGFSQSLLDAIKRADASGHLFVAAAGNGGADGVGDDNDTTPNYPSNYDSPNIISVAATNNQDALASFSNYGASTVDLAAPGVSILSTLPRNTYGSYSGTSMATPHVTGVAALLKSKDPSADDAQLKARILDYAEKKANLQGKTATGGRLNAQASLTQTGTGATGSDTTRPSVTQMRPAPDSRTRDRTPTIAATVSDDVSELSASSIRLYVDGAEKTNFSYDPSNDTLSYTSGRLSYGYHTVEIVATDEARNTTTESWRFRVVR